MQNIDVESEMFYSTTEDTVDWGKDVSDMLCQQGSESPVSKDLNDFIDSCELLDDSLIDQTIIYEEELVMEVQPHTDHSYSFPEACNEITILSDECIDDFFGYSSIPIQDSIIGSTNNEEIVLKDITEVILKDCTRRSRSSPTRSESSTSSGSKRGRPRSTPDVHLKRLDNTVSKAAAKKLRNNASSMTYRHKKSDQKQNSAQQLIQAEKRNVYLTLKYEKLSHDLNQIQLWLTAS